MGKLDLFKLQAYNSIEDSLPDSTTDSAVDFGDIQNFVYLFRITNDSQNDDLTFKLQATDNPSVTVKGGETVIIDESKISNIYLSNSSGNAIDYRILILGE